MLKKKQTQHRDNVHATGMHAFAPGLSSTGPPDLNEAGQARDEASRLLEIDVPRLLTVTSDLDNLILVGDQEHPRREPDSEAVSLNLVCNTTSRSPKMLRRACSRS